jgi:transposase
MRQVPCEEINVVDLHAALAATKPFIRPEQFQILEKVIRAYLSILAILREKSASLKRLRRMIFGAKTEKTQNVIKQASGGAAPPKKRSRSPGHGRNGAAAYWGAARQCVPHEKLEPGQRCPACGKGRLYEQRHDPGILVRVTGQAPLAAIIYLLQKLRCNLCGEVFEARAPIQGPDKKYDASAAAMIALLKYGAGLPFNRLQKLQKSVGVPLPAATQWDVVWAAAKTAQPAYDKLVEQAAQGKVIHNDDTTMKILAWMGRRRKEDPPGAEGEPEKTRTGIFTSGIVSMLPNARRVGLFFTGRKHAGENLKEVLQRRASGQRAPIQMCDALSRNLPKELKTILAHCLAHSRRQFVDVVENFPQECEHVLKVFEKVYKNDAIAKKRCLTPAQRLAFHQKNSGPVLEKLKTWMERQIEQKIVEPNAGLGQAIGYMLKHWTPLTLFLRKAGAPLDNNLCERALKKAILHRKNSLFFKTPNGAEAGDVFMSLIHTCELNGVDPFDYLTQLQRHAKDVREHPEKWLPWTYPKAKARPDARRCA